MSARPAVNLFIYLFIYLLDVMFDGKISRCDTRSFLFYYYFFFSFIFWFLFLTNVKVVHLSRTLHAQITDHRWLYYI
ncbi:hypothetical protein BGX38DRAFT_1181237 [Terfezia claveryi]|nr:hypothetical protein BGX38DRAFT_1181237 [Terfezia claveryi]